MKQAEEGKEHISSPDSPEHDAEVLALAVLQHGRDSEGSFFSALLNDLHDLYPLPEHCMKKSFRHLAHQHAIEQSAAV